jgi:hypothetical protein
MIAVHFVVILHPLCFSEAHPLASYLMSRAFDS